MIFFTKERDAFCLLRSGREIKQICSNISGFSQMSQKGTIDLNEVTLNIQTIRKQNKIKTLEKFKGFSLFFFLCYEMRKEEENELLKIDIQF